MRQFLIPLLLLAGCSPINAIPQDGSSSSISDTCTSQAACRFINSPVKLDSMRGRRLTSKPVVFYPTLEPVSFVDGSGFRWLAPAGTQTDGASIPQIFVPIIGQRTSRKFINAAAVHDAYCGKGNERRAPFQTAPWYQVHVMFYDALRTSGVEELRAKVMFSAVWLGGPRWSRVKALITQPALNLTPPTVQYTPVQFYPERQEHRKLQDALRRTIAFIEAQNPTIPELIAFMRLQERRILRESRLGIGEASRTRVCEDGNAGCSAPGNGPPPDNGPPPGGLPPPDIAL